MRKTDGGDGWTIVTFALPLGTDARVAAIYGDFNDWRGESHVLLPTGDGAPELALRLPPGRFEFRYLVDGETWFNDPDADDYAPNPFGGQNSVVYTIPADGAPTDVMTPAAG